MKKIFYFEKHIKINQKFWKLSITSKRLSSTKKTITNCPKSNEKLSKLKNNLFSIFVTLSLLSINSRVKQRDFSTFFNFVCFNVSRKQFTRVKIREKKFSINKNLNFNFSCVRFKFFHEVLTQKQSRRTHLTHLKWFFIMTQKMNNLK